MDALAIRICTAILALANAAVYSNRYLNVALLQPYHLLAQYYPDATTPLEGKTPSKFGSASALRMVFAGSALFNLMRPGALKFNVWLMAVCALSTQLLVVLRPATFHP